MDGSYEIKQGDKVIGQAKVEKQGLYYRFTCRCAPDGEGMHRLTVRCGGREVSLGILVPMDGMFGVDKSVPRKSLGEGTPEFFLPGTQKKPQGKFVAVYPEEPFSYIHRLEGAFLARQAGQLGIMLKE